MSVHIYLRMHIQQSQQNNLTEGTPSSSLGH